MSAKPKTRRCPRRAVVGLSAALSLVLPALPVAAAAPPTRGSTRRPPTRGAAPVKPSGNTPAPRATPGGTELSGDEAGGLAHNVCKKQPRGAKFRITLPKEAELEDLVNWMMSVSCQKFIWDPKVRSGKVTILSPEPVTIEEAYAAFYAALQTMGLTVEPSGEYFKIVETADAASKTLPVYGPAGRAPSNDRYVTQLMRIKSGNTKEVVDLLNKLKTKQGSVQNVGDLVILTDTGSSVRRLLRITRQLDEASAAAGEKIFFYQLQYADPEEVAEILRGVFGEKEKAKKNTRSRGKGRTASGAAADELEAEFSRVIVDERTGTLIIVAEAEDYAVIRKLIEQLDVPLAGGGGRIHVVKLENADPEEVANVLTQLGSGAQQGQQRGGRAGRRGAGQAGGDQGQGTASAELFSGEIKVTADPATRSLVILASMNDFRALMTVIEALDAERKQVYIEVYLLELSINKLLEGGASGHFASDFDTGQGQGLGFVSSAPDPNANSILLSPSILSGLAAGVLGPQVPGSGQFLGIGQDIPAFGVIIQALQSNNDVNVVAEPHLYTADNQEAMIEVGRNVPTPGAVSFPGGGQVGGLVPFQSIQRQDVTLNVKITPHVNDPRTVTLDIEMENQDIESIDPTLGVTTTKRRLKLDKVVARDDQPIVLGGLVQEVDRESTQQVPGLGSIPLLGWLFKRKRREKAKINLLMVLVPHVLETPDDARRIHKRRMQERFDFLERETAFKRRDLSTKVNYRKKSGLLATINREADRLEAEATFRDAAEAELDQQVITGEIGLSPAQSEEEEEQDDAGTTSVPTATPSAPRPRTKPRRKEK